MADRFHKYERPIGRSALDFSPALPCFVGLSAAERGAWQANGINTRNAAVHGAPRELRDLIGDLGGWEHHHHGTACREAAMSALPMDRTIEGDQRVVTRDVPRWYEYPDSPRRVAFYEAVHTAPRVGADLRIMVPGWLNWVWQDSPVAWYRKPAGLDGFPLPCSGAAVMEYVETWARIGECPVTALEFWDRATATLLSAMRNAPVWVGVTP